MNLTIRDIKTLAPIIVTEYLEELIKESLNESLAQAIIIKLNNNHWQFNFPFNRMKTSKLYRELTYWNNISLRREQLIPIIAKLKKIKRLKEDGINITHI